VHAFDGRILPVAEELWLEVVLAAKFRLGRGAGEELQNDLSFQVGRKRTSWPSHEENLLAWSSKVQVTGPALGAQCTPLLSLACSFLLVPILISSCHAFAVPLHILLLFGLVLIGWTDIWTRRMFTYSLRHIGPSFLLELIDVFLLRQQKCKQRFSLKSTGLCDTEQ
jgi:hypothetical protein